MLTYTNLIPDPKPCVKFLYYTGKWPNLCSGELALEIKGEKVTFSPRGYVPNVGIYPCFWSSGGGLNPNYEGTYQREWKIDVNKIPEEYRKYAAEIDKVFNENVEWGCCGDCI